MAEAEILWDFTSSRLPHDAAEGGVPLRGSSLRERRSRGFHESTLRFTGGRRANHTKQLGGVIHFCGLRRRISADPRVYMHTGQRSQIGTTLHWGATALVGLLGFYVQLGLFLVSISDKNRSLSGRFYRKMGWWAAKLSPMWKFEVVGPIPDYRPSRTVVVGNHQSQADPFLVSGLPWEMKWLGKRELFKIPFIGWSMHLAGDIPLVRGNRESAIDAMTKAGQYLQRDMPVMIFPEGTRSKDGQLLPFKTGAFRLAIENNADILPIAVAGTRYALEKGTMHPGKSHAVVSVGTPISTDGMTLDDMDHLIELTRLQIEGLRERLIPLSSEAHETMLTD